MALTNYYTHLMITKKYNKQFLCENEFKSHSRWAIRDGLVIFQFFSDLMKISNIKSTLPSFRYQKTCITKTLERYFKLQIIFILNRHFQNCPLLNFICYNTLNDIRHLCDIEFKNQIQNTKQEDLILDHPVRYFFS